MKIIVLPSNWKGFIEEFSSNFELRQLRKALRSIVNLRSHHSLEDSQDHHQLQELQFEQGRKSFYSHIENRFVLVKARMTKTKRAQTTLKKTIHFLPDLKLVESFSNLRARCFESFFFQRASLVQSVRKFIRSVGGFWNVNLVGPFILVGLIGFVECRGDVDAPGLFVARLTQKAQAKG